MLPPWFHCWWIWTAFIQRQRLVARKILPHCHFLWKKKGNALPKMRHVVRRMAQSLCQSTAGCHWKWQCKHSLPIVWCFLSWYASVQWRFSTKDGVFLSISMERPKRCLVPKCQSIWAFLHMSGWECFSTCSWVLCWLRPSFCYQIPAFSGLSASMQLSHLMWWEWFVPGCPALRFKGEFYNRLEVVWALHFPCEGLGSEQWRSTYRETRWCWLWMLVKCNQQDRIVVVGLVGGPPQTGWKWQRYEYYRIHCMT